MMNNFGCTSADVIAVMTAGAYLPTLGELGGATAVNKAIESAVSQIIQAMPEEVFQQIVNVDLEFVKTRAAAGDTTAQISFKPLKPGLTYVWKAQPRFFTHRPHKSTDILSDAEFTDPSTSRVLTELPDTAFSVNNGTGLITFTSPLEKNDQVLASYMPDTDAGGFTIPSLARTAADGATLLLGTKLYPRESSQWAFLDTIQNQWDKKIEQLQEKLWIPPEVRQIIYWKEVVPSGQQNNAIQIGRIVRG